MDGVKGVGWLYPPTKMKMREGRTFLHVNDCVTYVETQD